MFNSSNIWIPDKKTQHEVGDLINFREFDPLFTSDATKITAITLINSTQKKQATPGAESTIQCLSPFLPPIKTSNKLNPISAQPETNKNSFLPQVYIPARFFSPVNTEYSQNYYQF